MALCLQLQFTKEDPATYLELDPKPTESGLGYKQGHQQLSLLF
jgi:hypothetical protein